jgi:hypothetical protein
MYSGGFLPGGETPETSKSTMRLNATRTKLMEAGGLADQVYTQNYFYNYMNEVDAIHVGKYGRGVEFTLKTEGQGGAKWMSRFEKYNTDGHPKTQAASFKPMKLGTTARLDIDSVDENDSDEKVFDISAAAYQDALAEVEDKFEDGLHNAGTDAKAMLGLRALIADVPSSNPTAYNAGGIDRSVAAGAYFRNQFKDSSLIDAGAIATRLLPDVRDMFSRCVRNCPRGKAKENPTKQTRRWPNLIVTQWDLWDGWEGILDSNDRHEKSDKSASMGFPVFYIKGVVPVFPDDNSGMGTAAAGRVYMINTSHFGLYVESKANFAMGKWLEPQDQDVLISKVKVRAVLAYDVAKCHGVIFSCKAA